MRDKACEAGSVQAVGAQAWRSASGFWLCGGQGGRDILNQRGR